MFEVIYFVYVSSSFAFVFVSPTLILYMVELFLFYILLQYLITHCLMFSLVNVTDDIKFSQLLLRWFTLTLATRRCGSLFKSIIFKFIIQNSTLGTCREIALRWSHRALPMINQHRFRWGTKPVLNQCGSRYMSAYGVTRPQWIAMSIHSMLQRRHISVMRPNSLETRLFGQKFVWANNKENTKALYYRPLVKRIHCMVISGFPHSLTF